MSSVTILPAWRLETIPICCKITLTEGSFILDTSKEIAVQAINLSTLQHGFIAKAYISGWSSQPIGCNVFLVIFSRRCRSVLVRELQSGSAKGRVPGLRAKGATGSSLCWRQTEHNVEKKNSSSNICARTIDKFCITALHWLNWLQNLWMRV